MSSNTSGMETCPECHGSGKIPIGAHELVALIPYSDKRLRPRRTKLIIAISVLITSGIMGLCIFFFYPRAVTLSLTDVQTVNSTTCEDEFELFLNETFVVRNSNYVAVDVENLKFTVTYFDQVIGTDVLPHLSIGPRSDAVVTVMINSSNMQVSYRHIALVPCTGFLQKINLNFNLLGTVHFLSQSSQLTVDHSQSVSCANTRPCGVV
eukprot:Colp12_sorted_trinity150504_noHs@854